MPPKQKQRKSKSIEAPKLTNVISQRARSVTNTQKKSSITNGDIRRLCRRAGINRISSDTYQITKDIMQIFITQILNDALIFRDYANRSTITIVDIKRAFQRQGRSLFGFTEQFY